MRVTAIVVAALFSAPAYGQTAATVPHTVDVSGHGKVSVPPDTANIHYWLRGEGKTPDDATRAMVDAQTRVESGLKAYFGPEAKITNSELVVVETRDPNCKSPPGQPALSEGQCAILGYLASAQGDVRTANVAKAGTAVGLATRLGARDARLQSYELSDTTNALQQAMTRAVEDAHQQAQVLASAAGGHLGRAVKIGYGSYGAIFLTGTSVGGIPPAPPPPPPPPPVEIDMKPRPQDIAADVSVSYELLP
jgi:uncharacterized protein YggE